MKESLTAETVTITGHGGEQIEAYLATPKDAGSFGRQSAKYFPVTPLTSSEAANQMAVAALCAVSGRRVGSP